MRGEMEKYATATATQICSMGHRAHEAYTLYNSLERSKATSK